MATGNEYEGKLKKNAEEVDVHYNQGKLKIFEGELVARLRAFCGEPQEGEPPYKATIEFPNNPGAVINARC